MIKGKLKVNKHNLFAIAILLSTVFLFKSYGVKGTMPTVMALLSAACLGFFAWFYKEKPIYIFDKILISLYVAIYISNLFLQRKAVILIYTVYFFVTVGYEIYKLYTNKKTTYLIIFIYLGLFYCLASINDNYVFLDDNFNLRIASVIITAVVAVILVVLLFVKKIEFENPKLSNKALFMLIAVIITFFISITTIKNLNYCLDTSEPITYSAQVISKHIQRRSRGPDNYCLMLEINNKVYNFKVSESQFDKIDVKENINVYLYDGALSQPYFIQ